MTSKEHKKHAKLPMPCYGNYGRNEWAILGTNCGAIKNIVDNIITALSPGYNIAYVDAAHTESSLQTPYIEYTGHDNFAQVNYNNIPNKFMHHQIFSGCDAVFVNGNHNQAKAQIVVIDASKRESLRKRVAQLDNIVLILLQEGVTHIYDFIEGAVPHLDNIPVLKISDIEGIVSFFYLALAKTKPVLKGLVLAGGKSIRMGFDKTTIDWHGKGHSYYMADLLGGFCEEVYMSCREDQINGIDANYKTLADTFTGLGPMGAILSAFRQDPNSAWLVVASDLPLLDNTTLGTLVANRGTKNTATTFESPFDNLPEPLVTIWEPKSYPLLLSFLGLGYTCPRKVLINTNAKIIKPTDPDAIMNINTPEEAGLAKKMIEHKTVT